MDAPPRSRLWLLPVAAGVVLLLAAAGQVWVAPTVLAGRQQTLAAQWAAAAAAPVPAVAAHPTARPPTRAAPPVDGTPVARLWLPRLHLSWIVVQGVTDADLGRGPGHYPTSAMPGQVGNFAVAGHRMTGVFADLDRLQPGDTIDAQARHGPVWHYQVTTTLVVAPTAVDQVAAVPGHPHTTPTRAVLTLTTCWPRWGNSRRLIVHADLVESAPAPP